MCERTAVPAAIRCVLTCAVLAAAPLAVRAAEGGGPARRPNVLLIIADGHGPQAISAYGSRLARTPGIDRLAKEGMTFFRCFVTDPACGGTGTAALLTGTDGNTNGVRRAGDRLNADAPTFPARLRQAGYQTAFVGAWDVGGEPVGFDHWEVVADRAAYYNPTFVTAKGNEATTGYVTDLITGKALAWLRNGRDPAKPFCLVVRHVAPGRPWDTGPEQLTMYMDSIMPEPRSLFDDLAGRSGAVQQRRATIARDLTERDLKLQPPPGMTDAQRTAWDSVYRGENNFTRRSNPQGKALTRWRYQRWIKSYLCCVAAVDDGVGRLLTRLDRGNDANDTLVAYTADHGAFLGDHGWFGAGLAYEEPLTAPLLVRWPAGPVKPASYNTDLVSNLDLAATFLDAAGANDAVAATQGRSLVPPLRGRRPPADWRTAVYFHTAGSDGTAPHRGVRTARHKLIHFVESDEWELYDLDADPEEMKNLYADPAQAETVKRLKAELGRIQAAHKDGEGPKSHWSTEVVGFFDERSDSAQDQIVRHAGRHRRRVHRGARPLPAPGSLIVPGAIRRRDCHVYRRRRDLPLS